LNILSKELRDKYLRITKMGEKKTHLRHLKNTEDKLNKIDVKEEIKLELLASLKCVKSSTASRDVDKNQHYYQYNCTRDSAAENGHTATCQLLIDSYRRVL
jgi:hypothetical protein